MVSRNRVQAMIPREADVIDNPVGTAPGLHARIGRAEAFFTPGVPSEMKDMFARSIRPALQRFLAGRGVAGVIVSRTVHSIGAGESDVAEMLGDQMTRGRNPVVDTTVSHGIVSIRINAQASDEAAAQRLIAPLEADIRRRLGMLVFGIDDETLASVVGGLLRGGRATLATAESCTGGLVAKDVTDEPGSSDYFRAGWVTYSNEAKTALLGVDSEAIDRQGAVSEEVARQLAAHARRTARGSRLRPRDNRDRRADGRHGGKARGLGVHRVGRCGRRHGQTPRVSGQPDRGAAAGSQYRPGYAAAGVADNPAAHPGAVTMRT